MAKISDVEIPSLLFEEGASPANPAAGFQRLFVATVDGKLKLRDSGGVEYEYAQQVGTTKGDLFVFDGADLVRVGVGADDHVLTAASVEAAGVKWAASGGGTTEGFAAYRSTNQALSASTWTTIVFDTEERDDGADYNPATGQWTVPTTGWYLLTAFAFFALADGEYAMTAVRIGGAEVTRLQAGSAGAAGNDNRGGTVAVYLTAGNVVTVVAWRTNAGNVLSGANLTYFRAVNL